MPVKLGYIILMMFLGFVYLGLVTANGQSLETSTKLATIEVEREIFDRDAETREIIRGLASCQFPSQESDMTAREQTFHLLSRFKSDKKSSKHFMHGGGVLRDGKRTFTTIAGYWGLNSFPQPSDNVQWCKEEQGEQLFLIITETSTKQVTIMLWPFNNSPFGSRIYSLTSPKAEDKELFLRILRTVLINSNNSNLGKETINHKAQNE